MFFFFALCLPACGNELQLYEKLLKKTTYSEDDARVVMQQLLSAVLHLHRRVCVSTAVVTWSAL